MKTLKPLLKALKKLENRKSKNHLDFEIRALLSCFIEPQCRIVKQGSKYGVQYYEPTINKKGKFIWFAMSSLDDIKWYKSPEKAWYNAWLTVEMKFGGLHNKKIELT